MLAEDYQKLTDRKVIWAPMEGSQELALSCPCHQILLHGARGGGKTATQLAFFRRFVGLGYGVAWRGVIIDQSYKSLDDIISKSKEMFPGFKDGARFIASASALRWVWPTGEELLFRQMRTEADYWSLHGSQFGFLGFNELTKHPTPAVYDSCLSLNRSSFVPELHSPDLNNPLPEMPLVAFSTTNPFGSGHNWVKDRFIDPAPAGEVVSRSINVFNPRTQQKEDFITTQVHIFSSYKENRYLSPKYVADLESITDPNKREAWLHGSWNITSGGLFDDIFSHSENVIDPFRIPHNWYMFRSFDWGSSKPFSVGWWAESDGSDVQLPDGNFKSTVKGDLFRIDEWYGWEGQPDVGLKMLATQITKGMVERELKMGYGNRIRPGPADNSIHDVVNGNCIARDMGKPVRIGGHEHKGIQWGRSDKSPGSRVNGWELMRVAISNAQKPEYGVRESPGLFVFSNCKSGFIRTVPSLPRDIRKTDDADTNAEDHCADECRYVILSRGDNFKSGIISGLT